MCNVQISFILIIVNTVLDFSESQEQQLPEIVSRIDIKLLEGQSLCVKVSNVESVKKFFVQLHTAETSQAAIDSYMSNNQSEVSKSLFRYFVENFCFQIEFYYELENFFRD